jgi:aspartate/methionine/tyrosine aminotransferase
MIASKGSSAEAMVRYIDQSPGLRAPQLAVKIPGMPTLPDLKIMALERQEAGHEVVDQSAGDIDEVGQPLADAFIAWIEECRAKLVADGHAQFKPTAGEAYGFPAKYYPQYPVVTAQLARSWGARSTPVKALQTLSGRIAIDLGLRGLLTRADDAGKGARRCLILDPLAWSGYRPLADDLGLELVHAAATSGHGLATSAEGLEAAIAFARDQGLTPVAAVPILPSNPSGVSTPREELKRYLEVAAAADLPVMIDAFYSPLAPAGHASVVPLGWLEQNVAPEALGYLGLIVGETKVTSSQNKTASLLWMAPAGHDAVATRVTERALARLRATNAYPRPQEALVAYALHSFEDGVHAAMGPRYQALDATRAAMRAACDALGLPLSIGGSFYGTVALVDAQGQSLIRDDDGRPVEDPRAICKLMIQRHGLVGAPGGMFSPAPEAGPMLRLTAAVTPTEVEKVKLIFARLVEQSAAR